MGRRAVDLVAELADEADPQDQARDAGDEAAATVEILELLRGAVELGEAREDLARARPGQVDRAERLGQIGEVDVHAPVGEPPGEPLLDRAGAARGRRDVEALLVEAADRAVVGDPPGVGGHHAVAHASRREVREAVGVHHVEELARLRAAQQQLAERRDVDHAGGAVNAQRLLLGIAVVVGATPVAGPHHGRAERTVARVDRRALGGLERAPGERAHRHGRPRRSRRGQADLLGRLPGLGAHQPHRGQLAHATLAGPHRDRGVALGELDRVIALGDRQPDVLARDVLAQTGEALAAIGAADRWRHGDRRALRRGAGEALRNVLGELAVRLVAESERLRRARALERAGEGDCRSSRRLRRARRRRARHRAARRARSGRRPASTPPVRRTAAAASSPGPTRRSPARGRRRSGARGRRRSAVPARRR